MALPSAHTSLSPSLRLYLSAQSAYGDTPMPRPPPALKPVATRSWNNLISLNLRRPKQAGVTEGHGGAGAPCAEERAHEQSSRAAHTTSAVCARDARSLLQAFARGVRTL